MIVHLAIHHPKRGAEPALIDSMHRFGAAIKGSPGLIGVHTLQDEDSGVLMGLALWETRDAMRAAMPLVQAAVGDDPFDEWENQEIESFVLTAV